KQPRKTHTKRNRKPHRQKSHSNTTIDSTQKCNAKAAIHEAAVWRHRWRHCRVSGGHAASSAPRESTQSRELKQELTAVDDAPPRNSLEARFDAISMSVGR